MYPLRYIMLLSGVIKEYREKEKAGQDLQDYFFES